MDECVRDSKSAPYETSPILPKKLTAPSNKIPEEVYGHRAQIADELGDDR